MTELETLRDTARTLVQQGDELKKEHPKYYHKEFEDVFEIIFSLDTKSNKENPFSTKEVTARAIQKAGFANNEHFISDFNRYEEIFIQYYELEAEWYKVQGKILELQNRSTKQQMEECTDNTWQFIPIQIIAPQPFMETIENMMEADAQAGKGLFSNITNIPEEDEKEDKYLMIDVFGMQSSLVPFLDELKQYKIVGEKGFFFDDFKNILLSVIRDEAIFIKDHTDAPAKVKNHIHKTIKLFDQMPIWGLFFQILVLQGLSRWIDSININERDNNFNDVRSLYTWILERLMEKEIIFCYKPYGKDDRELLKPLCEYLYSTELGRMIQKELFHKKSQSNKASESILKEIAPEEECVENEKLMVSVEINDYFKYKYIRTDSGVIKKYLDEVKNDILTPMVGVKLKKQTIGNVCLTLYKRNLHDTHRITSFAKFVRVLCEYWHITPPKEQKENKYKILNTYSILERNFEQ